MTTKNSWTTALDAARRITAAEAEIEQQRPIRDRAIVEIRESGVPAAEIAAQLGISRQMISRIIKDAKIGK
jgi:DNA invertase Pin-like site-specific DNA recombinase